MIIYPELSGIAAFTRRIGFLAEIVGYSESARCSTSAQMLAQVKDE